MNEFDTKRLKVAIEYIRRMADGRNPVTNRPAADNEVINNVNVVRCLHFVQEVLEEVQNNGGLVGGKRKKMESRRVLAKRDMAEKFPYHVLEGFHYKQDLQISYLHKAIMELVPAEERDVLKIGVKTLTEWLMDQGFLCKEYMPDLDRKVTMPSRKGQSIGILAEKVTIPGNEYYRIIYKEEAQYYIVRHLRDILVSAAEKARIRSEEMQTTSKVI